jgi:hypothetical protein
VIDHPKKFTLPDIAAKSPKTYGIMRSIVNDGKITIDQAKWLLDFAMRLEAGVSPAEALAGQACASAGSGKLNNLYQTRKQQRDALIVEAYSMLNGKHWPRCVKLAGMVADLDRRLTANELYDPKTELERILLRAKNSGLKTVTSSKGINGIIGIFNSSI